MSGPEKSQFIIEPLGRHHNRAAFSCGSEVLDRYLRENAGQDTEKRSAVVYILTDVSHKRIYGFYTLAASSAPLSNFPPEIVKKLSKYPDVPVTLIGRLAVNKGDQGQGHGETLLMDALRRSYQGSLRVASTAIVVDAKDEKSATFYHKFGFVPFEAKPLRLFIPMKTIEKLILNP